MDHLFTPFRIKTVELKNRLVMSPLASFLFAEGGNITDALVEHYRRRAAGGPAMVIMEAVAVAADGRNSIKNGRIDHDRFIEGFSKIARVIRSEGSVPAIQIYHCGRQTPPRVIGKKPLAPSPLPCPSILAEVSPMTVQDIQEKVRDFGYAAQRAIQAGFELIEIHGAHGYLINQFLSSFSNIRTDAYGGSLIGRTLFPLQIIQEIRKRVGPRFPLSFKISAQEFVPNGITVPESIDILKILLNAGIDVVQVSGGNDATPEWICQPMFTNTACFADAAKEIRQAIDVPVMTVGRINDPCLADELIHMGKADLVCMGRGLLADPELPRKAAAGQLEDIRKCIACNTCMESIFKNGSIRCLVNPTLGRELEMPIKPARHRKHIMVVGGGPGGMTVASIAAQRGHRVDLFEKESFLGGQLVPGSHAGFKKEIRHLIQYQRRQVEKCGVCCHLDHSVTVDDIRQANPDVLILAVGSVPVMPAVPGIERDMVVSFEKVFNTNRWDFQNNIVIGGGPTGCEIALHLVQAGGKVTLVEMLSEIAVQLEAITRKVMLNKMKENHVILLPGHRLQSIDQQEVVLRDPHGNPKRLAADKVIIAVGTKPDTRLYDQVKTLGCKIYRIGDCLEARSAKDAIFEATQLGLEL